MGIMRDILVRSLGGSLMDPGVLFCFFVSLFYVYLLPFRLSRGHSLRLCLTLPVRLERWQVAEMKPLVLIPPCVSSMISLLLFWRL